MKTTKIKIGEIFEVEGDLYIIGKPDTSSEYSNEYGHMVCTLTVID